MSSQSNLLLALLAEDELEPLSPRFVRVDLAASATLYREGQLIDFVYFPEQGLVSMVSNLLDGGQTEVGIVGTDGMIGNPTTLGVATSYAEAMVQIPGTALRLSVADYKASLQQLPHLMTIMLHYTETLMAQVMQTAACNGRHDLEARLARWLLMCQDRNGDGVLPLTQDLLAMMLGVQRPSVSVTAGILQRAGLISYKSGRIRIEDRDGLEHASCECYGAVRRRFSELLGPEQDQAGSANGTSIPSARAKRN